MISIVESDAEFELLSMANEKRKFAIEIGLEVAHLQPAFERGIDEDWFRLVDVSFVAASVARGRLMRVFRLTDAGLARLAELAASRRRS
jgi:hypothetical protein